MKKIGLWFFSMLFPDLYHAYLSKKDKSSLPFEADTKDLGDGMRLGQHAISSEPHVLKALEDVGVLDKNREEGEAFMAIAFNTSSKKELEIFHTRLKAIAKHLSNSKTYEQALKQAKKLLHIADDLKGTAEYGDAARQMDDEKRESVFNLSEEKRTQLAEFFASVISKAPIHVKKSIERPLGNEDKLGSLKNGKNMFEVLNVGDEYKTTLIKTIMNSYMDTNDCAVCTRNILDLGLSYKEALIGGMLISSLNRFVDTIDKFTNTASIEFQEIKREELNSLLRIGAAYSMGIEFGESTEEDLAMEVKRYLNVKII